MNMDVNDVLCLEYPITHLFDSVVSFRLNEEQ